ncbi:MAG: type VI secretion system contractile sheath large subunit [Candidatus Eisenbacteria bacterium]|uniref:Type VI secretion system contractile sheath large subunit n=1 Tax=Eiseniibacteriota bacterium TaxID=2212470 RepID=A0A956NGT4_UNCEI|nr:type VI secretion system contractile sheath large subunit [Candidatus Eisenbacteria bacterium]MCB9463350.1 type VI secretion system contractile sheath large subunit [Candidatus Eisenbacteria bacterium]
MSPHLDFSFGFGPGGRRKEPGESTRILVLGDFSGRSSRGEVEPLGNRKPRKVDLDTFDDVFAMLAPQLRLDVSPDLTVTITPREIDDLHPDAIFQSVSAFDELRTLRARLADPKTFADAARTLGGGAGSSSAGGTSAPSASESAPASAPDATSAGAPPGGEASSGDGLTEFQRLLGGTGGNRSPGAGGAGATGGASSRGDRSATSPAGRVRSWIEELVGAHIVPDRDPSQDLYLVAIDDTIGELLRAILHHPQFQAHESAWRSLQQLVQDGAEIESMELFLLDASETEWTEDLLSGTGLAGLLSADRNPGDPAWSWVVVDPRVGSDERSIQAMEALTQLAAKAGTAVVGSASPQLLGTDSLEDQVDSGTWSTPTGTLESAWNGLRSNAAADHLALLIPRVLLRLPYGKATEPLDRLSFEELGGREGHEAYLWGNPAYSIALAASMAAESEHAPVFGPVSARAAGLGSLTLTGLPVHVLKDDDGPGMKPCAEAFLTERAAEELTKRGFTAVVSIRNADRAKVWRLRSVASSDD